MSTHTQKVRRTDLSLTVLCACNKQVCGLSTLYCCYTVDNKPVAADIPDVWPPVATPVPAALRGANLNCASGNCTEGAPSPSPAVPSPTPSAPGPLPEASSAPVTAPSPAVLGPGASIGQRLAEAEPGLGAPVAPATAAAPVPSFASGPGPVTQVTAAQKSSASISSGVIGGIAGKPFPGHLKCTML